MNILFYDDSPVFGGHEVMALMGLESILAEFSGPIHFIASACNLKLCEKVTALASTCSNLTLERASYHSSKLEALRNRLRPSRAVHLAARFRQLNPSLVVAIQGNIEHSSLALHAARLAGIRSTSYIPVPHSNAEMGARLGALRDMFSSELFKLPDSFITITDEMARLLEKRGATAPIHIVYNGIDIERFRPGDARAACNELELPFNRMRIGMIGRIEFRQKQQHLLVEAVAADPALAANCHLVFAGEGPDSGALGCLVAHRGLSSTVLPWTDPARLYQALAALVIPSRYEGLPLVMLEALASNTAVLASDRDGMKDLLPPEWRFRQNDIGAITAALTRFAGQGLPKPPSELFDKVRTTLSLGTFRRCFATTVLQLANSSPSSARNRADFVRPTQGLQACEDYRKLPICK